LCGLFSFEAADFSKFLISFLVIVYAISTLLKTYENDLRQKAAELIQKLAILVIIFLLARLVFMMLIR
jgi:uncharacterized membrane protein